MPAQNKPKPPSYASPRNPSPPPNAPHATPCFKKSHFTPPSKNTIGVDELRDVVPWKREVVVLRRAETSGGSLSAAAHSRQSSGDTTGGSMPLQPVSSSQAALPSPESSPRFLPLPVTLHSFSDCQLVSSHVSQIFDGRFLRDYLLIPQRPVFCLLIPQESISGPLNRALHSFSGGFFLFRLLSLDFSLFLDLHQGFTRSCSCCCAHYKRS